MTNREQSGIAAPTSSRPPAAQRWSTGQSRAVPLSDGTRSAPRPAPPRPKRRVRKTILGVAGLALFAAAFALVVTALQPGQRSPLDRLMPSQSVAPSPSVAPTTAGATPSVSLTPLDPGVLGRQIDRQLVETRQLERISVVPRWVSLVGAILLIGMAVFLLVVFPDNGSESSPFEGQGRLRTLTVLLVLLTILGSVAEIPLRAGIEGHLGFMGVTNPDTLLFVARGPVAVSALLRIAGVVLILAMLVGRFTTVKRPFSVVRGGVAVVGGVHISGRASRRLAMAVGIAVTLSSFVVVGHAQATEPRALLMAADLLHVVAASVWLGGVVMLTVMLRKLRRVRKAAPAHAPDPGLNQARKEMAVVVGRFSVAATASVMGVTVAGVGLAISQLGSVDALYKTSYGITLVIKLVLVGFVMLLGGYNHRFLVPRVIENEADERAWRRLRHAVTTEVMVIVFGVLVATIALSSGGFGALAR